MRRMQTWLIAASLGLAVLGGAMAMPPGGHHGRGDFGPGMMGPPMERVLHRLERLGIDDAQRNRIEQILEVQRDGTNELRERLREQADALRQMAGGSDYDAAKVKTMADELGASVSQMVMSKAETWQKVRAVLTAEQQARLDEFRQRWGERGKRCRDKGF